MDRARQRAVADAVSVNVFVAGETAEAVEIFLAEHLAAIDRRGRIFERIGHPVVHAEIEIGHDEDQRLELLGQIEGLGRHGEALFHGAGKQHDVLRIAVRKECGRKNVALRSARGQAGGGTDALNVPDDAGNFNVIRESGELRHQRDARSGGRGHAARARPACADDHADGGQFIFRLHDGEGRFAVGADAVFLHVVDHRFDQRRRRRDRIPGDDGASGEHAAERGGGVAVDDDLARGLVHALDVERAALLQIRLGVVEAGLRRGQIQIGGLHFLRELLADGLLDFGHVDGEQAGDDADVHHVLDQLAQLGFRAHRGHQLVVGNRVESQIVAQLVRARAVRRREPMRREPATWCLRPPSRDSWPPGSRFPSCGRCSRSCWRGWCTRWAVRRCSTGTCSCRRRARPSEKCCATRTVFELCEPEPLTVAT